MSDIERDEAEGWGVIRPGDRKAHYYRKGMSLCRRVGFYFGALDGDDKPSPDDCAACRKVLTREAVQAAKEPQSWPPSTRT